MPDILQTVKSDSNPGKTYDIIRAKDGSTYCTCWGWKRYRKCRHLRAFNGPKWDEPKITVRPNDGAFEVRARKAVDNI